MKDYFMEGTECAASHRIFTTGDSEAKAAGDDVCMKSDAEKGNFGSVETFNSVMGGRFNLLCALTFSHVSTSATVH